MRHLLISLAIVALLAPAARAEGTLNDALSGIVEDVAKFLADKGEKNITLGQFRGVGDLASQSSAGPNLVRELTLLFAAKEIRVEPKSNYFLQGEYGEVEDVKTERQAVDLKAEVIERATRKKAVELQRFVTNQPAVVSLLGLAVELPPDGNKKKRDEKLKDAVDGKTKPVFDGTRILTGKESPFAIEVLVSPPDPKKDGKRTPADYQAKKPEDKNGNGLAFVPIAREEVYAVRLSNTADFDVAVDLRIDGLSVFTFSDEKFRDKKTKQPLFRYLVVPKGHSVLIRGWHVTNDDSDEFLVTSYAKSAAGQLGSSANVGTITANFHAAWPKTGTPPADEPKKADEFSQSADATGRGKRFDMKYEVVEYNVGVFRAAASVRYSK